jgi:NAD(P)-dependent dehydrogenase (short-subunit alcohol dehydrogenase family)
VNPTGIAPGLIETPLTAASLADPAVREERLARIPLGRIGRPEDLVPVVLLLASDESNWMTGTVIVVDGGQIVA